MSKNKRFLSNQRRHKRSVKPVLLLEVEGKTNQTERLYFQSFSNQSSPFIVRILKSGDTDPVRMSKAIRKAWETRDLSADDGDIGFVITDLDLDHDKEIKLQEAERQLENVPINLCVSNPCFEIWYLLHFEYSTHGFSNNSEVINNLKKYIPKYQKNGDYYPILTRKTSDAINNAKKLSKYHNEQQHKWISTQCNPQTDVYKIVELLEEEK